MPLVILQPCSNKGSREHYEDTIKKPVSISSIEPYLSKHELHDLSRIYPDSQLRIWGVTPGLGKSQNIKKWQRIQPGDVTLLAAKGEVFATAVTTYKLHNPVLAERLWGRDGNGQTWEYVYFVSEVQEVSIPYIELNRVIPYADNFVIQGFSVLNEEQSWNVLSNFDLSSETFYPEVEEGELFAVLKEEESLDQTSSSTARKEQSALRRILFNNSPLGQCSICNNEFPVTFLVAAHIKKRSKCSLEEKKDFHNIVAPMCKFGCDELYEKGFVGVDAGKVIRIKRELTSNRVEGYISEIEQNSCPYFTNDSEKYFRWHIETHRVD